MNTAQKKKVIEAIKADRMRFETAEQHANYLALNPAQYSRVYNGETDKVMAGEKWQDIANLLIADWVVVETEMFIKVTATLEHAHAESTFVCIVDDAGLGKTVAARHYCGSHKNAAYVDCSLHKSKKSLIKAIAKAFGMAVSGRYEDIMRAVTGFMQRNGALLVLDEAGDLQADAFLELKAIYNATDGFSGLVIMGADGLRAMVERRKSNNKIGYAEIFDRFDQEFVRFSPQGGEERKLFNQTAAAQIIKANAPKGTSLQTMVNKTQGNLRRIRKEIAKLKTAA